MYLFITLRIDFWVWSAQFSWYFLWQEKIKGLSINLSGLEQELDAMKPIGRDVKTVRSQLDDINKLLKKVVWTFFLFWAKFHVTQPYFIYVYYAFIFMPCPMRLSPITREGRTEKPQCRETEIKREMTYMCFIKGGTSE